MKLAYLVAGLLPFISAALAQQSENWCDPSSNICFQRYQEPVHNIIMASVFPADATRNEFIGEIVAPTDIKWAGYALGGSMVGDLLIVAWPNADDIVVSTRMATTYALPPLYPGPVVTKLPSTSVNSTHWKFAFRCQNCTSWTTREGSTGRISDEFQVQSFAASTRPPNNPADPASTFTIHTDFGTWGHAVVRTDQYDLYLSGGAPVPPPTTTSTATPTTTTTSSTVVPTSTVAPTPYDYIVVGAGPAGLVMADRLSEAGKSVLLIERGGPSTKNTGGTREVPDWLNTTGLTRFDVPGLFESMFSSLDPWWWCDDINVFAGCLMGGGTAINGMLYYPPPDSEFSPAQGWPSGWRNPQSGIDKMLARLPSYDISSSDGKRYLDQVYDLLAPHFSSLGYKALTINSNRNAKDGVFGHPAYNFNKGIRWGPTATYFQTAKARPNFKLLMWTDALSVVRSGGVITGVQTNNTWELPGGLATLTPKGRVILSAGVFGTSKILFQSGIGPLDMLRIVESSSRSSLLPNATQYMNLPVGNHVSDNPSINLVFTHPLVDDFNNWQNISTTPREADAAQYVADQSGVFASSSPRFNFWKALNGPDGVTRYMQGTARPGGGPVTDLPYNASAIFTITFYLSEGVTSRGRIGIDAALKGKPLTGPWFQDEQDKAALTQGIKDAIEGMETNLPPGLVRITPDNTTTLDEFIDAYPPESMNSNHWVGSTRIGTDASTSVVDQNCKVWGTDNLFIVDAGIIPGQPMSNVHATIMTVAELAAIRILALSGGP